MLCMVRARDEWATHSFVNLLSEPANPADFGGAQENICSKGLRKDKERRHADTEKLPS